MTDYIIKCVEKLQSNNWDEGDEVDELHDKIRKVEKNLPVMRHKRSLVEIYIKDLRKLKKTMGNNKTLADRHLHEICTDIMKNSGELEKE